MPKRDWAQTAWDGVQKFIARSEGREYVPPGEPKVEATKDPAAVARGRKGGAVGGKARAAKLTPGERADIAREAALRRWAKKA